jgi:hypothetical protein
MFHVVLGLGNPGVCFGVNRVKAQAGFYGTVAEDGGIYRMFLTMCSKMKRWSLFRKPRSFIG